MEYEKKICYEWTYHEMNLKQCVSFTMYYDDKFIYFPDRSLSA